VSPFIDIYIKTVHLVAPELPADSSIDLNVSQQVVLRDLIAHIGQADQGYEAGYLLKVTHFLILILTPPIPFVNSAIDQVEFAKLLLSMDSGN